jgi:predicted nucleic acid-binding protein
MNAVTTVGSNWLPAAVWISASALAQAVSAGQLASEAVTDASQRIGSVPIVLHQPGDTPTVVAMAQRLEHRSADDAAYVVLAEELGKQRWTLDGRLARNAAARGLPVHRIQTDQRPSCAVVKRHPPARQTRRAARAEVGWLH